VLPFIGRLVAAKRTQQGSRPRRFSSENSTHCDADAVNKAEGSIRTTDIARSRRVAGVPNIAEAQTSTHCVHTNRQNNRTSQGGSEATIVFDRSSDHEPVGKQLKTLNAKLRGHYQYYGRPTNSRSIWQPATRHCPARLRGERRCGHGRPKRARSWKRQMQPKKTYRPPGSLPYSER
jgi:hypothetical protein